MYSIINFFRGKIEWHRFSIFLMFPLHLVYCSTNNMIPREKIFSRDHEDTYAQLLLRVDHRSILPLIISYAEQWLMCMCHWITRRLFRISTQSCPILSSVVDVARSSTFTLARPLYSAESLLWISVSQKQNYGTAFVHDAIGQWRSHAYIATCHKWRNLCHVSAWKRINPHSQPTHDYKKSAFIFCLYWEYKNPATIQWKKSISYKTYQSKKCKFFFRSMWMHDY